MSTEDKIRSLTRNQIRVLFWRCREKMYKEIALKYPNKDGSPKSLQWARGLMTSVYSKLGVDKKATSAEREEFLQTEVCEIVDYLLDGKEENLEKWPLYGMEVLADTGEEVIYVEKKEDDTPETPDPEILAFVLLDEKEEERLSQDRAQDQERRRRIYEERIRRRTERLRKEAEERRKAWEDEEERKKQKKTINVEEPKRLPGPTRPRGCGFWVSLILGLFFILAGVFVLGLMTNISFRSSETPASAFSPTPKDTSTPENTLTSTISPSPTISPTPVPLSIREDFSKQYSDLWRVFGNPIITEKVQWYSSFSGVLTAKDGTTATLWIGNTAWTDLIVSAAIDLAGKNIVIGLRVVDLNNMVGLKCRAGPVCHWVIIDGGILDDIPGEQVLKLEAVTITVQGNTFTAIDTTGFSSSMSLVLPPKYEGRFSGGGVLLQIDSSLEVDYIQIDPIP